MLARQWGAAHVETWDETVVLRELFLSGTLLCDEDEPARAARGGAGQPQVAGQSQIATSIRSHSRPQCYATDWVEARKEARHVAAPNSPAREHAEGSIPFYLSG